MSKETPATEPPNVLRLRERLAYKRLTEEFALLAREYRKKTGLSLEALSKQSRVSLSRLKKFEAAKAAPYFGEMLLLAQIYRVPASSIATRLQALYDKIVSEQESAANQKAAS